MKASSTQHAEDELRCHILHALEQLSSLDHQTSKDDLRALHAQAVKIQLEQNQTWLKKHYPRYAGYFANGVDIEPLKIKPFLMEVIETFTKK